MSAQQQPEQTKALTARQQAFVEAYVGPARFNAAKAAIQAGYSERSAKQLGHELLHMPHVAAAIDAYKMGAQEWALTVAEQARGSFKDFIRFGEREVVLRRTIRREGEDEIEEIETTIQAYAEIDLRQADERGKLDLIKKYSVTKEGTVTLELYDKQTALGLIGKHEGLLIDRHQHSGSISLTPEKAVELSDEELEALMKERGLL